jgi:hypothetical protein
MARKTEAKNANTVLRCGRGEAVGNRGLLGHVEVGGGNRGLRFVLGQQLS